MKIVAKISIKSFSSLDDVIGKLGPPVEKSIVLFVIGGFDLVMEKSKTTYTTSK